MPTSPPASPPGLAHHRCCGSARCGTGCQSPCRSACTAPPWPASPGRRHPAAAPATHPPPSGRRPPPRRPAAGQAWVVQLVPHTGRQPRAAKGTLTLGHGVDSSHPRCSRAHPGTKTHGCDPSLLAPPPPLPHLLVLGVDAGRGGVEEALHIGLPRRLNHVEAAARGRGGEGAELGVSGVEQPRWGDQQVEQQRRYALHGPLMHGCARVHLCGGAPCVRPPDHGVVVHDDRVVGLDEAHAAHVGGQVEHVVAALDNLQAVTAWRRAG